MTPPARPPLVAADPARWIDQHLTSYFRHLAELRAQDEAAGLREYALADLLGGGPGDLRARYEGELVEGWPPQAAVTGVVSAYAGALTGFVCYAAFASGAHWRVSTERVRWHVDDEGWPAAVTLHGPHDVVVAPGHPWAALAGVVVEPDPAGRARRCLDALVTVVAPIVDHGRTFTKVGRAGLWNSVVDAMGHALMYQEAFPAEASHAEVVRHLVDRADQPWKARPLVLAVGTEHGDVCVSQRAGCCLVFTATSSDETEEHDDDHEHDEMHARFYEIFVDPPDAPGYCNDCSLRSQDDCIPRLVWWRTEELKARHAGPDP